MKLARPDLFHPRIVLASCRELPAGDGDDAGLVGALRRRGLHAHWLPWDDPGTERADLVILRATWDYPARRDEFLAWTRRVAHLLNPAAVVAWNSDKHYLRDLAEAGVPVAASRFAEPGGAGPGLPSRVVSPADARVAVRETACVFLGGEQSHAFTKAPMLPSGGQAPPLDGSGAVVTESLGPADPDAEIWELGYGALDVACALLGVARHELLYARVDVIGRTGDAVVLELDLIEPALGWSQLGKRNRELAQRQFALQVESACERMGLGPLSHRGP
jgi:hypothetical protein